MSLPLETIRRQTREAQQDFAADVDRIRARMKDFAASLMPAIGEVSHGQALEELRADTIKAFERCLERR